MYVICVITNNQTVSLVIFIQGKLRLSIALPKMNTNSIQCTCDVFTGCIYVLICCVHRNREANKKAQNTHGPCSSPLSVSHKTSSIPPIKAKILLFCFAFFQNFGCYFNHYFCLTVFGAIVVAQTYVVSCP